MANIGGCSVTTKLAKETLDIVKSQNHRIQELTDENFKMVEEVKNLRNDVVYEMAKRLKAFTKNDLMIKAFIDKAIDNIVKEMLCDKNISKIGHNSLCETETYKGAK